MRISLAGRYFYWDRYSLIRVSLGVLLIGAILGMAMFTNYTQNRRPAEAKLAEQIVSLNSALLTYEISGGSLEELATADQVLLELKLFAKKRVQVRDPEKSQAFIDPRIVALPISMERAAEPRTRAIWNPVTKRFALTKTGGNGISEFAFADGRGNLGRGFPAVHIVRGPRN